MHWCRQAHGQPGVVELAKRARFDEDDGPVLLRKEYSGFGVERGKYLWRGGEDGETGKRDLVEGHLCDYGRSMCG